MASYDRKFEITRPTLDRLVRDAGRVIANAQLLDPTYSLSIVDGEFMQLDSTGKIIRSADASKPSFACIDDRGDTGIQVTKRLTLLMGGSYQAKTRIYADALAGAAFGTALDIGTVNSAQSGSVNRTGLVAHTSGLIHGYVLKSPVDATGLLEFIQTLV